MALLYKLLSGIAGQKLVCPFYHAVSDDPPPHLRHVFSVRSEGRFKKDIDFFLKHYHPVSLEELYQIMINQKKLRCPSFFLSFDDGLREVKEVIAPILISKGIPATFFINPSFVDNSDMMYRYKASLLTAHFFSGSSSTRDCVKRVLLSSCRRCSTGKDIMHVDYQSRHLLDQLANILEVDFEEYLKNQRPYLDLGELKELESKGFSIGGHGEEHPYYADISLGEQIQQTMNSVSYVMEHFSQPIRAFAFPFTDYKVSKDFFTQVFYKEPNPLHVSFGTAGMKKDILPNHLHRIPMERFSWNASHEIFRQYLYYLLKVPLGKNTIFRK